MRARHIVPLWLSGGIFILLFLLMAPLISALRLYIDDFPYLLDAPQLTTDFIAFAKGYAQVHGIYRPVAQLWYYVLYNIYLFSPALSHLIPWAAHVTASGILVYVLVHHGMYAPFALITGVLSAVLPFGVEQYGWLSATPGTLAYLLLVVQLWVIQKCRSLATSLFTVGVLSLSSIFLYESTFFFPIILCYLILQKWPQKKRVIFFASFGMLGLLYGLFIASKLFVQGTDVRPLVSSLDGIVHQWNSMWIAISGLVWGFPAQEQFWSAYTDLGATAFVRFPYHLLLSALLVAYGYTVFSHTRTHQNDKSPKWKFWIASVLLSLIPLLVNKEFYFGFRSLVLPTICGLVTLGFILQRILAPQGKQAYVLIATAVSIQWMLVSMGMVTAYRRQYTQDMAVSKGIAEAITPYAPKSIAITSQLQLDSRDAYLYADFLHSCFYYSWSAPACLKATTGRQLNIGIVHPDGRAELPKPFSNWDEYRNQADISITLHADTTVTVNQRTNTP